MLFVSIPIKFLLDEIPKRSVLSDILRIKEICDPWVLFFILSNILSDKKTTKNLILALLLMLGLSIFLLILAVFDIAMIGRVNTSHGGRAGFIEPNQYAALLVLFIPLLISIIIAEKGKIKKIIGGCFSFTAFFSLFITGSRGGFLAFAFSMFTYSVLLLKNRILKKSIFLLLIILLSFAAIGGYNFAPTKYKMTILKRFDPNEAENIDDYTSGRTEVWKTGIDFFLESPIFGHGIDAFQKLYDLRFQRQIFTHNEYLMYIVNYGIIGFLLFFMMFIRIFRHLLHSLNIKEDNLSKLLYIGYMSGAAGYLVAAFGVNYTTVNRTLFWIYTAAIYRYSALENSE